jgi:hypothetical protein
MAISQADLAEEVVHTLDDSVAKFVYEQGTLHLGALQVASHALDARATQVATILFAAAALSAGVIDAKFSWASFLAVVATACFIWGGLVTFRLLRSDDLRLPGVAPAWWQGALSIPNFSEKDALAWAAKLQQVAIEHFETENAKRADALNASLRLAVIGAVVVGLAAAARLAPAVSAFISKNF